MLSGHLPIHSKPFTSKCPRSFTSTTIGWPLNLTDPDRFCRPRLLARRPPGAPGSGAGKTQEHAKKTQSQCKAGGGASTPRAPRPKMPGNHTPPRSISPSWTTWTTNKPSSPRSSPKSSARPPSGSRLSTAPSPSPSKSTVSSPVPSAKKAPSNSPSAAPDSPTPSAPSAPTPTASPSPQDVTSPRPLPVTLPRRTASPPETQAPTAEPPPPPPLP